MKEKKNFLVRQNICKKTIYEKIIKNYKPSEINIGTYPHNADINIIIDIKGFEKGDKLLYWAANPRSFIHSQKLRLREDAYNFNNKKHKNLGCTSYRKDGKISVKIIAPQCYYEDDKLMAKHFHLVKKTKNQDSWDIKNIYTVIALPLEVDNIFYSKKILSTNIYMTPMQVKLNWKKGFFFMVYALGDKYKSLHDIEEYQGFNHLRLDYTKNIEVPKNIKKTEILVVYCAKKTCNAAKKLMYKLSEKGYQNLFYMPEGMIGFSKEAKKIFMS